MRCADAVEGVAVLDVVLLQIIMHRRIVQKQAAALQRGVNGSVLMEIPVETGSGTSSWSFLHPAPYT